MIMLLLLATFWAVLVSGFSSDGLTAVATVPVGMYFFVLVSMLHVDTESMILMPNTINNRAGARSSQHPLSRPGLRCPPDIGAM